MRRIGIDVGGTNTDAVLLDGARVVHAVKAPTTEDVTGGIVAALSRLTRHPDIAGTQVDAIVVGTTHFINAVVQRRHLSKVAAVRVGTPARASLPPFCDWPADLAELVRAEVFMLEGGHDYDGRPIMPFDETAMRAAARDIRAKGTQSVGVASIFSPLAMRADLRGVGRANFARRGAGSGQAAAALADLLRGAEMLAATEALRIGQSFGLEPGMLLDIGGG